ncbi:hypothetical protein BRARA_I00279 [Brassica rapa]|uniref:Methyltransferase n=1 Tax=Brassica campestris TaxID=3711 RepID=A0A397XYY0_BRACM|nr:hypothetical protein BRARA_I00279 [Brassica rapa]
MGSVSLKIGDGTARFRRTSVYSSAVNLLMLFSVVTTNLFALYAFSSHSQSSSHPLHHSNNISLVSQHLSLILREIDSSQRKLAQMEKQILGYESIDLSRPNIVPDGLDVEGKPEKMEFLMFDLDRVLKPGGLFWLDNFYCASDVKKKELTRLIERFGYKKLKWVIGEKADGQVNLSAVLQKPVRV